MHGQQWRLYYCLTCTSAILIPHERRTDRSARTVRWYLHLIPRIYTGTGAAPGHMATQPSCTRLHRWGVCGGAVHSGGSADRSHPPRSFRSGLEVQPVDCRELRATGQAVVLHSAGRAGQRWYSCRSAGAKHCRNLRSPLFKILALLFKANRSHTT